MVSEQSTYQNGEKSASPGGVWFAEIPSTEVFEIHGKEGIDLLERISTNELAKMEMGAWKQTILTNEKGRMIDSVWIGRRAVDRILLLGTSHIPEKTKLWIERFIIMEDIRIVRSDTRFRHLMAMGKVELHEDLQLIEWEEIFGDVKMRHILLPEVDEREAIQVLSERGALRRSESEFETFRIAAGMPLANEINENFNPLEAGLNHLISWTKGCYVGQEVIARLDTYKKVQKHLVRLEISGTVKNVPIPIKSGALEAGTLTSVTTQEPFIGLGYLATRQLERGDDLYVDGEVGRVRIKLKG